MITMKINLTMILLAMSNLLVIIVRARSNIMKIGTSEQKARQTCKGLKLNKPDKGIIKLIFE